MGICLYVTMSMGAIVAGSWLATDVFDLKAEDQAIVMVDLDSFDLR